MASGQCERLISLNAERFERVCFGTDNNTLYISDSEAKLHVWDLTNDRLIKTFSEDHTISCVAIHPKSPIFSYCTFDKGGKQNCKVFDRVTGRALFGAIADTHGVSFVIFSPDGSLMATVGSECVIRIWKLDEILKK